MDLANNQRGLSVGEALKKTGNFSGEKMIQEFKKELKMGKIIVLKPKQEKK